MSVAQHPVDLQDDGDASKADDRAAGAAANGHQAAERAKSEKWQAARAAVKAAAAEEDRRRADLEMLMMPDAELRHAGEFSHRAAAPSSSSCPLYILSL